MFVLSWLPRMERMGDLVLNATTPYQLSGMQVLSQVYLKWSTEAESQWNKK